MNSNESSAPIFAISRHRMATDGKGVTTLVLIHACPLDCIYCLNPRSLGDAEGIQLITPAELYETVRIDELYYLATGGGVTFGGGEPGLRPEFIARFREICGPEWSICIETSLNVPRESVETLLSVADSFIIDIKDMNPVTYSDYTGRDNSRVIANLQLIADRSRQVDCLIRLPLIPGFNNDSDRDASRTALEALGFKQFDLFTYIIRHH